MVRARRSRNQRTGPGRARAKAARLGPVRPGPDHGPRRRSVTWQSRCKWGAEMKRLEGKVAVVTEAVGSVGLATARKFVDEGARVFITGRDRAQLDAALETLGNKATAVQGVVADPGDLDRLYARIMEDTRAIDVLFANAGVVEFPRFGEVTEEHFHRVF